MLLATVTAQDADWRLAHGGHVADCTNFYVQQSPAEFSVDEPMKISINRFCEPMKVAGYHLGGEPMRLPRTSDNYSNKELLTADRLLASEGMTESLKKGAKEADDGYDFASQETQSPPTSNDSNPELQSVAPLELPPTNEGSRGHPDFCSRPCLYFAAGSCFNGESCHFCHIPHDKRTVHLDKRNRASLHSLDFADRLDLVLPAILDRARNLGVAGSLEHHFAEVKELMDRSKTNGEHTTVKKLVANERGKLKSVLKGLRVQELFKMLKHPSAPTSVQVSIDMLYSEMQEVVLKGHCSPLESDEHARSSNGESHH
jgi:hypothetical protein